MRALFKGAKLEVESVIREVCERVLYDTSINKETQRLRAQALGILGEVYSSVVKSEAPAAQNPDAEYVKVDTSSSKARESQQQPANAQDTPYEPYKPRNRKIET